MSIHIHPSTESGEDGYYRAVVDLCLSREEALALGQFLALLDSGPIDIDPTLLDMDDATSDLLTPIVLTEDERLVTQRRVHDLDIHRIEPTQPTLRYLGISASDFAAKEAAAIAGCKAGLFKGISAGARWAAIREEQST